MSEFKVGDRVKVASFEGEIDYVSRNGKLIDVAYDGSAYAIPASLGTKIAEPLKVGDVITSKNVNLAEVGTVVVNDIPVGIVVRKGDDGWRATNSSNQILDSTVTYWDKPTVVYVP